MKVLIAEDELTSRMILTANLKKWGFDVYSVKDGLEAMEALQGPEAPQLVILDWLMPGMDGVEVCKKVRAAEEAKEDECYTYIILLTGCSEAEDVVEGMNAGADDYVVKPYDLQELKVRLKAGRRIVELQQALMKSQRDLKDLSMHDHLTGIFNRRAVLDKLSLEMPRAEREKAPLSIAILDIDFFKKINDSFGHSAGDTVLKEFVKRILATIRPYDILGRYGGEEFLLILIGASGSSSATAFERVREAIGSEPFAIEGRDIEVRVSIGGAQFCYGETVDALIERADKALYRAKEEGRNRVVLAPDPEKTP